MSDAENLGVDMDADTDGGRHSRAGMAAKALRFLVLLFFLGCSAPTVEIPRVIEYDGAELRRESVGFWADVKLTPDTVDGVWRVPVGEPFAIVSWPSRIGAHPSQGRVPGHVRWTVEGAGDAAEVLQANDTLTLILFHRLPPGPVRLHAKPEPLRKRFEL